MTLSTIDRTGTGLPARPDDSAARSMPGGRTSPDPHGASIRLCGLSRRYGAAMAVDGVSLDVAPGEFVSLLGPSGSGKTTTLMMVAGFTVPDEGRILLGDRDITRLPPYRRNIGMVHQSYALFPHMSVRRNVAFPLRMRGASAAEIAQRVRRALDLVQLRGFDERLPAQLSGGQQQRVALARALVFEPPLLLMDEPLGALDKKLRVDLQIEIKRIQREVGSTMLYVTHDQDEALSMSDRVVVMNHGRIEQIDTPGVIYERPFSRFVADFLGASNFLTATVEAMGEIATVVTERGLRLRVAASGARSAGERVSLSLRPERIRLSSDPDETAIVRGTILEASFFGSAQRYLVEVGGGETLTATRPSLGDPMLPVGAPVGMSWGVGDAWIIPSAEA